MPATAKDPVIVVLQLTGGNDYLNTVIPYNNSLYKDNRKAVGIADSGRQLPTRMSAFSPDCTLIPTRNRCGARM